MICCDLHGTTQWKFKNSRVLQGPRGISVDSVGNMYVVGYNSNNVAWLSPQMDIGNYCLPRIDWYYHMYLIMTYLPIGY